MLHHIFIEINIYLPMELREIKGIGKTFEEKLMKAGIKEAEDLVKMDLKQVAEKTGISIKRLEKWQEGVKNKLGYKKAEVAEDLSKIAIIEIRDNKAKVKIKEIWHENIPVFKGNFDELKEEMEKEDIAVYIGKKAKLWFTGKWFENIPYRIHKEKKVEKKSLWDKLKELWKR